MIVNETLATTVAGGDVVGRSLVVGADRQVVRVVGVAGDARYRAIADAGACTCIGRSGRLQPDAARPHHRRSAPALVAVQGVLDGVGPGVVGFFPRTMDDHLAGELLPARVAAVAATGSAPSVTLSGVGLYGLVAWLVERRRREIAVRLALGADRRRSSGWSWRSGVSRRARHRGRACSPRHSRSRSRSALRRRSARSVGVRHRLRSRWSRWSSWPLWRPARARHASIRSRSSAIRSRGCRRLRGLPFVPAFRYTDPSGTAVLPTRSTRPVSRARSSAG